ncbi:MAG TPA: SAM-dependent methyltransferase [Candidatus Limnocylindrales bacterium]
MHVEWRRDDSPAQDRAAARTSAALAESIRAEIAAAGPITFARFMERALYDPAFGYYVSAVDRPTRSGDFLTAPELHPIFGHTLARQIDEMWRLMGQPEPFVAREYGAGSGALFAAILDGLVRLGSPLAATVRYDPIDFARQRALIEHRLADAGRAAQLVRVADDHVVHAGVVIANEYLDALPVHRVINLSGELRELYVAWRNERFTEVAGPISDESVARWFTNAGVTLAEGQRAEANLAMLAWIDELAREMERGFVLIVDYGAGAAQLYGPDHPTGTIRAFARQRVSSDVLSEPGSRDITASIDFDALEGHARACGFDIVGRRRTNEYLLAAGLDDVYEQARGGAENSWDEALLLRGAISRLLDPNALGGYEVSVLARNVPGDPPLSGFQKLPGKR